jgi:hypothetical protein
MDKPTTIVRSSVFGIDLDAKNHNGKQKLTGKLQHDSKQ